MVVRSVVTRTWLAFPAVAVCLCGCAKRTSPGKPVPAKPLTDSEKKLVSANTTFAFNLFAELRKGQPRENVFVSPSSIALALAMTYNGAAGKTKEAMAEALSLEDLTIGELNEANASLRKSLSRPDRNVELTVANSLWAQKGVTFPSAFVQANSRFYGAHLSELDFASPDAPKTINHWVRKETKGKIEEIVDSSIPETTVLFLINATYFKGMWSEPFEKRETEPKPFTLLDGTKKTVSMMLRKNTCSYLRGDGFQAAALPYSDGRFRFYLFVPERDNSLKQFCDSLSTRTWKKWTSGFGEEEDVLVQLPRFTNKYGVVLNSALRALGMGIAFEPGGADFTGMGGSLWIREVKHKTYVAVDEKGTEAAAATPVEMQKAAVLSPKEVIADRPFFCAIVADRTETILFMGAIVDPQES